MTSSPLSPPLVGFPGLGVPQALSAALERQGILVPFPVQAATLPDCLAGHDVCGRAPTGSGKTLAFGLAVLSRIALKPTKARPGRGQPSALVLVPTRELAAQIDQVMRPLAGAVAARTAPVYGGVGYAKQLTAIRKGADVLIACPGRLTDLVQRGSVDLSQVGIVVIDEADRMADMGFLPAVRRLLDMTSASRQTLLFSATLDGPVEKLVRDYQHDPRRHDVEPSNADRGMVHHHFWRVEAHNRVAVTAETVTARGPAIVFCRTKRGADRLSDRLARSGLQSAPIHGDRSQSQRERALAAFRAGRLDVLVATDVAARGIDVEGVPLIVHFDPPADPIDYVHRSGRTGRAGARGIVLSLVGPEHLNSTTLVQRQLGLARTISAPDVPSLAVVRGDSPASAVQRVARDVPAVRAKGRVAAPRTTAGARRPSARRPARPQGGR